MSKRQRVILFALAGAVAVWAVVKFATDKEPRYEGKPLHYWVGLFDPSAMDTIGPLRNDRATEAVRHMGTNAFPFLLDWIAYEYAYEYPGTRWWNRLPPAIRNSKPIQNVFSYNPKGRRAISAGNAIMALGPDAAPTFPQLAALLVTTTNFALRTRCMWILMNIGEPAVPALTTAAVDKRSHTNHSIQQVLWALAAMGTNASAAAPTLRALAQDADLADKKEYTNTINRITGHPVEEDPSLTH